MALAATPAEVGTVAGVQVFGFILINPGTAAHYIKLYDKATTPVVGTDTPIATIPVALAGYNEEMPEGDQFNKLTSIFYATNKLWVACTANPIDTDTTAPQTAGVVQLLYAQ